MTKLKTLALVAFICIFAPSAYGQLAGTPLAMQDFNGTWIPTGWSATEGSGFGNNWFRNDGFQELNSGVYVPMVNHTGGSGTCAAAADVDPANANAWNAQLYSPLFSLANYSAATVSFRHALVHGTNGVGYFWVWNGAAWANVLTYNADTSGPVTYDLGLVPGALGSAGVQICFDFESGGNDDSYWQIDDVTVTGIVITGIDLQANWGVFRYDGRLFTRVDVRNLGWNPSGTFSVTQQVWDPTFTELKYNTTRTFTQNSRGRALLPGRMKSAKFWVTNRSDLHNDWVFVNVVRAAGPDDNDENSVLWVGPQSNMLFRQIR